MKATWLNIKRKFRCIVQSHGILKKRFTRLKMAQTDFDIFRASCSWSNKWSQQIFMYWSIGCQNVLTNLNPRLIDWLLHSTLMGSRLVVMRSSGLLSSRKARLCFALLLVNGLLIVGIFVSASRRPSESNVFSPSPEADKTNVPSVGYSPKERSVILQSLNVNTIPADIRDTLLKVHRYLETQTTIDATGKCQFAWKFNSTQNYLDLFTCK